MILSERMNMNVEGGISISVPSIGPAITGPAIGPSFSLVNEGPVPIGSFENFSPLIPSAPDLGGTIGPIEALNATFPVVEPQPMANIFNEGPAPLPFLENSRPLMPADFPYSPKSMEIIANPFHHSYSDPISETRSSETIKKVTTKINRAPKALSTIRVDPAIQSEVASKQQEVVYEVEDKKVGDKAFKEKSQIELTVKKLIKDQNALASRLADARAAIENAFYQLQKNGKKAVSGEDVEQYVPSEYIDVRSGVLKKKSNDDIPDGSYVLGKTAIRKITQTSSKDEMQTKVNEAIYGNGPVTESSGQEGEEATEEEVEKVYLFRNDRPPIRILERRIIKKREIVNSQTNFNGYTKTAEVPTEIEMQTEEEQFQDVKPLLQEVFKVAA